MVDFLSNPYDIKEQTIMLIAFIASDPSKWLYDEKFLKESGIDEIKFCDKCYKRGYRGLNIETGLYFLCPCVIKAIVNREKIDIKKLTKPKNKGEIK